MVIKYWKMLIMFLATPLMAQGQGMKHIGIDELNRLGTFVRIPSGMYEIGDAGPVDIIPTHKALSHIPMHGFDIMDTVVTQEFYAKVMGFNPARHARAQHCPENFMEIKIQERALALCPTHPVERVSFDEAQAFVDRLNKLDKKHIYSLPNEDQLEVAFAAENGLEGLEDYLWHRNNARNQTESVRSKRANKFGVYRCGIWEWTLNFYMGNHRRDIIAAQETPLLLQIIKGGSFDSSANRAAASFRAFNERNARYDNLGFRIVRRVRIAS